MALSEKSKDIFFLLKGDFDLSIEQDEESDIQKIKSFIKLKNKFAKLYVKN